MGKLNFLKVFLFDVSIFYNITFTTNYPTNMTNKLLFLITAMTVSACLAQPNQQGAACSNIGAYAQAESIPATRIPAYEVTVDDLVNTPWDASNPKNQLPWNSMEDFNGAQLLEPLSITLEISQDLLIHLGNTNGLWNRGIITQRGDGLETDEVEIALYTLNYGGLGNFLISRGQLPLYGFNNVLQPIKNEQDITYHFRNSHAGETRLEMVYCIDDHGIMNNNKCNGTGKKINVKNIFVTTK